MVPELANHVALDHLVAPAVTHDPGQSFGDELCAKTETVAFTNRLSTSRTMTFT